MKHLIFLSTLILFYFITCSQPKIDKITWVGQNNEYLNIGKEKAILQKGMEYQEFKISKIEKNDFIILSKKDNKEKLEQKYNIVHLTNDTLILSPNGADFFELCQPNEKNQYIFVNNMLNYKFVELYLEYSFKARYDTIRIVLYIDSTKKSRIVIKDEYFDEAKVYTSPILDYEYESLVKILSSCDISCIPEEGEMIEEVCQNSFLEIRYNDQIKIFKGCARFPANCNAKFSNFLLDYIFKKTGLDAPKRFGFWVY